MSPSLSPARKGYRFQDIAAAVLLARATILDAHVTIILDKKLHPADRFDDVTLVFGPESIRRQIKSSVKEAPEWKVDDFTTENRNLRIDMLAKSALADAAFESTRYAAAAPFAMSAELRPFVIPTDRLMPAVSGSVQTWRFDLEKLWPPDGEPAWKVLSAVDRADFVRFSERFVIESHVPAASLDLDAPGPLERTLFEVVGDEIGIGVYPNRDRRIEDVAAALIDIAYQFGTAGGEITGTTVTRRLAIRTDYGRVAQQFPIIRTALVERRTLVEQFTAAALKESGTALVGPPGSGKSWLLTEAAETLVKTGALVARHYCYLEPGDEEVQRRVTTDALFANLIAELLDRDPALADAARPRFASGPRELERLLTAAAEADPGRPIVLFIDGLDHITRVAETASSIARDDTAIVDELALLSLPSTVRLVVASQPGSHLDPIRDRVTMFAMPSWSEGEVALLAAKLGVPEAMEEAGFDEKDVRETLAALAVRADGNPLYATFLCRTVVVRLREDGTAPLEALGDAPKIEGDISRYYASLLPPTEHVAHAVADVLAFVDFGLTADELRTIFPLHAPYIDAALKRLRPVLHVVTAQGGVRLYHESLRRFIVSQFDEGAQGAAARILPPVIAWLENAGLFASSRAYRFLLPLLARTGLMADVAARIGPDFVERSVAHGHAPAAIRANLSLAVNTAAEAGDWPSLVRAVELERARLTYGGRMEHAPLLARYGKAFVALFGADALNERLMFDGKPTLDRKAGLVCCSLCEDAGATPPWREYLQLRGDDADDDGTPQSSDVTVEAAFHGYLRVRPRRALASLVKWMADGAGAPRFAHAFALIRRAVTIVGADMVLTSGAALAGAARVVLTLGVAEALHREDPSRAKALLTDLPVADCPRSLLDRLASLSERHVEAFAVAADVDEVGTIVPDGRRFGAAETADWLAAVRLAASVAPDRLPEVTAALAGGGWGHAWLRFAIAVAEAEVLADNGARDTAVLHALRDLRDTESHPDPFSLIDVAPAIHATVRRALALIGAPEAFRDAVDILASFSRSTQSHFQGSSMGALVTEDFLDLLTPYVGDPARADVVFDSMRTRVDATEAYGEFYETHAEHDLQLAQIYAATDRRSEAEERWKRAATNLTAYGWRRDITAFEPIESLEVIAETAPDEAQKRLVEMQTLAENVIEHTDGKDTKWILHRWFEALRVADPARAMDLLARSIPTTDGGIDWRIEGAYEEIANHIGDLPVRPLLAAHIQAAARATGNVEDTTARIRVFERLVAAGDDPAPLVTILAGAMTGDAKSLPSGAVEALTTFAEAHAIPLPRMSPRANPNESPLPGGTRREAAPAHDALPYTARELVLTVHTGRYEFRDNPDGVEIYAQQLGFRLLGLNDEVAAIRVMRVFARAAFYGEGDQVLAALGEGLARFGATTLAATAYALAYAYAQPNWSVFGSRDARPWFVAAAKIDKDIAHGVLRAEAMYFFTKYGGSSGLTRHPIELFATLGDIDRALAIWDASVGVIRRRLPLATDGYRALLRYDPEQSDPSMDAAAASLLVARAMHPEYERKRAALAGITALIAAGEEAIVPPIAEALRSGALTMRLALLNILDCLDDEALWCIPTLAPTLREAAGDEYFGVRVLAASLLDRIADTGERLAPSTSVVPDRELSTQEVETLMSVDDRAEALDRVVTGYGETFARYLDEASRDVDRKERIRERSTLFFDRVLERFPENILYEHQEIVEEALHRTASALIRDGGTPDAERVADFLSLRVERHVTHWYSRAPRPGSLPRPSERSAGATSPEPLDDPGYPGWYRIGYYERERLRERKVLGKLTGTRIAMSGVQLHPGGKPNLSSCLVNGNHPQRGASICTTAMHTDSSAFGRVYLLLPAKELIGRFSLVPGSWRGPLVAHDQNGVALVFRQWREEPLGDDFEREDPVLRGCELLLRPDLYSALCVSASGEASDVTIISNIDERETGDVEESET